MFEVNRSLARASYLRDRWAPEMQRSLDDALGGDDGALRIVAAEWKRMEGQLDAAASVTFEDGLVPQEHAALSAAIDHFRDIQRQSWRKARESKDNALQSTGWADPSVGGPVKERSFNQVLMDWTTQDQILNKGIAVDGVSLHNTRDALYADAQPPGRGPFHAARTRMFGQEFSKKWGNWGIMWVTTCLLMLVLAMKESIRTPGRPRRT